jgi:hypothetical protein
MDEDSELGVSPPYRNLPSSETLELLIADRHPLPSVARIIMRPDVD